MLIIMRMIQGINGAMVMANSTALVADAFPKQARGRALGINVMVVVVGQIPWRSVRDSLARREHGHDALHRFHDATRHVLDPPRRHARDLLGHRSRHLWRSSGADVARVYHGPA